MSAPANTRARIVGGLAAALAAEVDARKEYRMSLPGYPEFYLGPARPARSVLRKRCLWASRRVMLWMDRWIVAADAGLMDGEPVPGDLAEAWGHALKPVTRRAGKMLMMPNTD